MTPWKIMQTTLYISLMDCISPNWQRPRGRRCYLKFQLFNISEICLCFVCSMLI